MQTVAIFENKKIRLVLMQCGDPAVVLAETEEFIAEEENMPLDQNLSSEQRDFYFKRRLLIRSHPRAEAIYMRYVCQIQSR